MKGRIKWDTPIEAFTKKETEELVMEIFYFCRKSLGMIPRNGSYPLIWIRPRKKSGSFGEYSPHMHMIEIFSAECESLRRFVDTVIHEYTHACQPWIGVRYTAYSKKFGYQKNPFEIEARRVAKENRTECLKHLSNVFE